MDRRLIEAIARPAPVDANKLFYDITEEVKSARESGFPLQAPTEKNLEKLVARIIDGRTPPRTRRWAATVLLCFAQEWEKTRKHLTRSKNLRNSVGALVLGDNEELRILGAALVATMWETENQLDRIWPIDAYPDIDPAEFPRDLQSVKWFHDLRRFTAAAQDPTVGVNLSPSFVAITAEVDGRHLQLGCELLCIAGHRFTIMSAVPQGDTAFFLDIPYGIIRVDAQHAILEDSITRSQGSAPVLRLKLAHDPQRRCDLNATKHKLSEVKLFLPNDKALDRGLRILEKAIDHNATQLLHSSGAVLDLSRYSTVDREEEGHDDQARNVPDEDVQMEDALQLDDVVPDETRAEPADGLDRTEPLQVAAVSIMQVEEDDDLLEPPPPSIKGSAKKSARQTRKKVPQVSADEAPLSSRLRPRKKPQPHMTFTNAPKAKKTSTKSKAASVEEKEVAETNDLWDVPYSPQAAKTLPKETTGIPKTAASKATKNVELRHVKPKIADPAVAKGNAEEDVTGAGASHQSMDRISETPDPRQDEQTSFNPDTIIVQESVLWQAEEERTEQADAKSEKRGSRKTHVRASNVWDTLVPDANDEPPPMKLRAEPAVNTTKTSSAGGKKRNVPHSSSRSNAPASGSRGFQKPGSSLVDERSVRKKNIVTFGKQGPRNQGRRPAQQIFGSPKETEDHDMMNLLSSPPPDISAAQTSASRSVAKTGSSNGVRGQSNQASSKTTSSASKKRPLAGPSSASQSKKVKVARPDIGDDGFISLEQYESSAFARNVDVKSKYPQKRMLTHITEEGSPRTGKESFEGEHAHANPVDTEDEVEDVLQQQAVGTRVTASGATAEVAAVQDVAGTPDAEHVSSPYISSSPPMIRQAQATQTDPFAIADRLKGPPSAFAEKLAASATKKEKIEFAAKAKTSESKMPPNVDVTLNDRVDDVGPGPAVHIDVRPKALQTTEAAISREDDMDVDSDSSSDIDMDEVEAQDKAAEAEWEAALQPRHRTLLASFTRISRQFIAHVMNCEDAFYDEIDRYFQEASGIVENMDAEHLAQVQKLHGGFHGHERRANIVTSLGQEHIKVRDEAMQRRAAWQKLEQVRTQQLEQFKSDMEEDTVA